MNQRLDYAIKNALETWDEPDSPEAFSLAMMNLRAAYGSQLHRKPRVIAFAGPAGVGKSTAAEFLAKKLGDAKVLSFASPMKRMVAEILPLGMEAFTQANKNNPEHGLCGKSPRFLLEKIGTEWGKQMIGQDIWLDIVANQIKAGGFDTFLIDDLRTDAEADYVHERFGGKVIELERDGVDYAMTHITSSPISTYRVDRKVKTEKIEDLEGLAELVRSM